MTTPGDFRIAIIAPFPHPRTISEGWMARISSIDTQFKGLARIYLNFSEAYDDSQCNEIRHDAERAEVFLNPLGKNSAAFVSDLAETVDAFYVHTLHLAEYVLPWLKTGKVYVDIHGITPEEEVLLGNVHLRKRYETVERDVLQGAKCCIGVSRAMMEHYAEKYPSLRPKWLILPVNMFFPSAPETTGNLSPTTTGCRCCTAAASRSGRTSRRCWRSLNQPVGRSHSCFCRTTTFRSANGSRILR